MVWLSRIDKYWNQFNGILKHELIFCLQPWNAFTSVLWYMFPHFPIMIKVDKFQLIVTLFHQIIKMASLKLLLNYRYVFIILDDLHAKIGESNYILVIFSVFRDFLDFFQNLLLQ
uniref:Uncharacterized protein n=1 Tax=Fibrocapsa japonica TaxID=94617 RepID=A0A7S2V3U9_9STRA